MNKETINLAELVLETINEESRIREFVEVSNNGIDLDKLPLANLFYHLELYYDQGTTVKSVLNFLLEDVGINKGHCVLILAIADDDLYQIVATMIAEETDRFYIARAVTLNEANDLTRFFSLSNLSCGFITEHHIDGNHCGSLLEYRSHLPSGVITEGASVPEIVSLLSKGANAIIDSQSPVFHRQFKRSFLKEMFLI